MIEIEPAGSNFKLNAVCCTHCNSILGVMDYHNTGRQLQLVQKENGELKQALSLLQRDIRDVQTMLQGLR